MWLRLARVAVVAREPTIIIIILKIDVVIIVAIHIGLSKKLENPFPLLLDRFFVAPLSPYPSMDPVACIVFSVDRNTPHALPIFSTNYCSDESFSPLLCRPIGACSIRKKIITRLESVRAMDLRARLRSRDFKRCRRAWKIKEHNAANPFNGNGRSRNCEAVTRKFNVLTDLARI